MDGPMLSEAQVLQKGSTLNVRHGADDNLIVEFYHEAEKQGAESEKAGRPIYKDVPYIWIRFPGDRTRDIKRRVNMRGGRGQPPDPDRFARQWAAFQNKQTQVHEGTPIEEWGPISKSLALMYKGANVHTVEQLASVPDSSLQNLGHGGREMRDKAVSWLKATQGSAELMSLKKENTELKDDIEMLKKQVAELAKGKGKK